MAPALRAGTRPVATAAHSPIDAPARTAHGLLRYLDIAVCLIAVPVGLMFGAPAFGFLIGIGAWLLQRALAHTDRRFIARRRKPGSRLGLNFADAFGRIWLLAGAIVVAGAVGHRSDGLAAAVTIFAAYSVAFSMRLLSGRQGFEL